MPATAGGDSSRRSMTRTRSVATAASCAKREDGGGGVPLAIPIEDLGATKRRLVCIRRQSDVAPIQLQVGFKSRTGWQPLTVSKENQDSLALVLPLAEPLQEYSVFAVFDGHGRMGHRVSAFVAENVVRQFRAVLTADKTVGAEGALRRACLKTNKLLMTHPKLDVSMTGTTAAVAVIHGRRLTCANVGDSRIVVGTVRNGLLVPTVLTTDHLPGEPGERRRIEEAGGRVERWTPGGLDTGPPRVWLKERRLPGLAMSRVLGDSILNGIVSAEPDLRAYELKEEDLFVVVATDGVWGQMSNEEVVRFVGEMGRESCQRVAECLVRHAAGLWWGGGEGIDDISVVLIRLMW